MGTKEEIIIREADSSEANEVMRVGAVSYGQYREVLGEHWPKMDSFLNSMDILLGLFEKGFCFVAEVGGELAGISFLVPRGNRDDIYKDEWSQLRYLGVLPEFGRRGIARKLTERCIEKSRELKEEYLALHSADYMNGAPKIYQSMGFKPVETIERYGMNYSIYLLELEYDS